MTLFPIAQAPWEAVRDTLRTGGSVGSLLWFGAGLLLVCGALVVVHRIQLHRNERPRHHQPQKLFLEVLRELDLTVVQRDLLRRIVADLNLDHPAILLLSPVIYDDCTNRWNLRHLGSAPDAGRLRTSLAELRAMLFGPPESVADPSPMTGSSPRSTSTVMSVSPPLSRTSAQPPSGKSTPAP